jgi:hypothetical protein
MLKRWEKSAQSMDTVGALALFWQQQLLYYILFVKDKSMGH